MRLALLLLGLTGAAAQDIPGCTDSGYLEYNSAANVDDGSCATLQHEGCMASTAINYNPNANVDDGSCANAKLVLNFAGTATGNPNDDYGSMYAYVKMTTEGDEGDEGQRFSPPIGSGTKVFLVNIPDTQTVTFQYVCPTAENGVYNRPSCWSKQGQSYVYREDVYSVYTTKGEFKYIENGAYLSGYTNPNDFDQLAGEYSVGLCGDNGACEGCTDSAYGEFNWRATSDDGSCSTESSACVDTMGSNRGYSERWGPDVEIQCMHMMIPAVGLICNDECCPLYNQHGNDASYTFSATDMCCDCGGGAHISGIASESIICPANRVRKEIIVPVPGNSAETLSQERCLTCREWFFEKYGNDANDAHVNYLFPTQNNACRCVGDMSECGGCTDSTAFNYNPTATLDDGSCQLLTEWTPAQLKQAYRHLNGCGGDPVVAPAVYTALPASSRPTLAQLKATFDAARPCD